MVKRSWWSIPAVALLGAAWVAPHAVSQARAVPAPVKAAALVKTAPARILVNGQGLTLYLYTPDKHNKSVCSGECAEYWPPVLVPKGTSVPTKLAGLPGTFGVAPRGNGARQLTYDGAPLYTFVKDKKAGDMTGQGLQGTWWVVVTGS